MSEKTSNQILIDKLEAEHELTRGEWVMLLSTYTDEDRAYAAERARAVADSVYGKSIFIRGIVEFSNVCKNNCYYCGIRAGNDCLERYRLTEEEIFECCKAGYEYGFRTFVLQGGEDPYYTDDIMCEIVSSIRKNYPDCAITLSVGEKTRETYEKYFEAGANRYLLRHETALDEHYKKLHPNNMSLENRKKCLFELKKIGFQVGSGFMVGSPYQKPDNILADLRFLQELSPDMIGIGPYISHEDTPFKDKKSGSLELTIRLIAILRLMFPYALIPSTTALGTIHPEGRELGLKAGANVVMPNLSPVKVRKLYTLYDNKICTGEEAAQCIECLKNRVKNAGYEIVTDIGNVKEH